MARLRQPRGGRPLRSRYRATRHHLERPTPGSPPHDRGLGQATGLRTPRTGGTVAQLNRSRRARNRRGSAAARNECDTLFAAGSSPLRPGAVLAARFVLSDLGTKGGLVSDTPAGCSAGTARPPRLSRAGDTAASVFGSVSPAPAPHSAPRWCSRRWRCGASAPPSGIETRAALRLRVRAAQCAVTACAPSRGRPSASSCGRREERLLQDHKDHRHDRDRTLMSACRLRADDRRHLAWKSRWRAVAVGVRVHKRDRLDGVGAHDPDHGAEDLLPVDVHVPTYRSMSVGPRKKPCSCPGTTTRDRRPRPVRPARPRCRSTR